MDSDLILVKLDSLKRSVERIELKRPKNREDLNDNFDLQDILVVNLERTVQTAVDIALHILSDLKVPAPDTMSESFRILEKHGILSSELSARLFSAVGFRNVAVHQYQKIDWDIVYHIIWNEVEDFRRFAVAVAHYMGR